MNTVARLHPSLIVSGPRTSAERWSRFVRPDQLYRQARVSGIKKETDDAVSVTLTPMDDQPCIATAGQYLTLITELDNERIKRAYSLSQLPSEHGFTITSKRIDNGRMSGHLNDALKIGDVLQFAGPSGDFVLPQTAPQHYVFAAAGSGITPIMAMLDQLLSIEHSSTQITLLYGNRQEKDILFKPRLDAIANAHKNIVVRYFLTQPPKNWKGDKGRIGIEHFPAAENACFFLCGPASFNQNLVTALRAQGVASDAVRIEHFSQITQASRPHPEHPHPVVFQLPNGESREVTVRPSETLLEAGLRTGIPLQFSCTMGGCGHCRVTVSEGDVAVDEPNCLTESERLAGQALACCARPHSRASVTLPELAS